MSALEELRRLVAAKNPDERERIEAAAAWAAEKLEGRVRASGEAAVEHPLRVAVIVAELGLDADSIVAAALHHALDPVYKAAAAEGKDAGRKEAGAREAGTREAGARDADAREANPKALLAERFGVVPAQLVEELARVEALRARNKTIQAAETIRKMLFAMAKDIRVILVKLADKLDSMRTLKWLPDEDRRRIAQECLDIFAPLADRLGVAGVKDELEDLSLKELNPEAYAQIKKIVAERKGERERFLERVAADIRLAAREEGYEDVEIKARAKHFYSIYRKMRKKAKDAEELYDLLGIRILCGSEGECYALVGVVHRLWKPIEGRFKDYVAMPKANGYRSLHTTVMGYEGRLLEIQIRTREMDREAEFGVASHWLYKKGSGAESPRVEDLPVVTKLRDLEGLLEGGADFLEGIKREILGDSIFVFTPRGDVVQLPAGATPLDFAFAIHSDVGLRCVAAKVDGAIVPLSGELRNTQVVDIVTSATAHPSINWLRSVRTSKARAKIRQWLVANGQALVIEKNVVAKRSEEAKAEARAEAERAEKAKEAAKAAEAPEEAPRQTELHYYIPREALDSTRAGLSVGGTAHMMIRFAGCCRPTTNDEIVGYVSRGRGIIVHRASCRQLASIPDYAERSIEVEWETERKGLERRWRVSAKRGADLFSEVEAAVRKRRAKLLEGRLEDDGDGIVGWFTIVLEKGEDAKAIEKSIRGIPSIRKVEAL